MGLGIWTQSICQKTLKGTLRVTACFITPLGTRLTGEIFKILTHGTPQEYKEQSDWVENVVGGNPEDKLEIEGVKLRDQKEDGDAQDGHPALEAAQRIPRELNPTVRRKLINRKSMRCIDQ